MSPQNMWDSFIWGIWLGGQSNAMAIVVYVKTYIQNLICKWGWKSRLQNLSVKCVLKALLEKWKVRHKNIGNMI